MQYSKGNNFQSNVQQNSTQSAQHEDINIAGSGLGDNPTEEPGQQQESTPEKEEPGQQETTTEQQQEPIPFPVEVFPEPIQDIIEALNDKRTYPKEFTGASMLYAASVAAGNGFHVERPFTQVPVLYLAMVALSGKVKSHPLSFAVQPLQIIDDDLFTEYERAYEEFKKSSEESAVKPKLKTRTVQDITPEALAQTHYYNKRGLGLYKQELTSWFETFDRYARNADQAFWLSNWDSTPISQTRKTADSFRIKHPFISVAGTIQAAKLAKLAGNERAETGFIDRILFVVPDKLQNVRWGNYSDTSNEEDNWEKIINRIESQSRERFEGKDDTNNTTLVNFNDDAYQRLIQWQNKVADKMDEAEDKGNHGHIQLLAKLQTYCIRLALLLSILDEAVKENPGQPIITNDNVKGAIRLSAYFEEHGQKARQTAGAENKLDNKTVINWLSAKGATQNQIAAAVRISQPAVAKHLKE